MFSKELRMAEEREIMQFLDSICYAFGFYELYHSEKLIVFYFLRWGKCYDCLTKGPFSWKRSESFM